MILDRILLTSDLARSLLGLRRHGRCVWVVGNWGLWCCRLSRPEQRNLVAFGQVQTMLDESYTSQNPQRLDVEGTFKKSRTTDYAQKVLNMVNEKLKVYDAYE